MEIYTPPDLIKPVVTLSYTDGGAGAIVAKVARALRRAGNHKNVVDAFRKEALSGDYDHLLQTCMTYAEVE